MSIKTYNEFAPLILEQTSNKLQNKAAPSFDFTSIFTSFLNRPVHNTNKNIFCSDDYKQNVYQYKIVKNDELNKAVNFIKSNYTNIRSMNVIIRLYFLIIILIYDQIIIVK